MKRLPKRLPSLLIGSGVVIAVISVGVASYRDLTSLENTLLWALALGLGLIGSYNLGNQSAEEAGRAIIKPHARSAFRRLMSLYESLSRVGKEIEASKENQSETITIAKLESIVLEQLATADDALEDWRDIVPEEVEELRKRLRTGRQREQGE